jgi:hypothetical protein
MNNYFDWVTSLKRFVRFDTARAEDINDALDELSAGLDDLQLDVNRSIKLPIGTADQTLALSPGARANKVLSFDESGNVTATDPAVETATAQAVIATTQAGIATTQAGIATTKAAEAAASAASIAGGPVASVNGMTGIVTGIAIDTGTASISTNTTAVRGKTYAIAASLKLTTFANPNPGDWFAFRNFSGTTTASIGYSDQAIEGDAADWVLDDENAMGRMVYVDATRKWRFFL